jgi:hypothetical protein
MWEIAYRGHNHERRVAGLIWVREGELFWEGG